MLDCCFNETLDSAPLASSTENLKSLASVGAGTHVTQNIEYVTGLTQPKLDKVVKVRYMWWDDLVAKAKSCGLYPEIPSGFPADEKPIMSIGSTPRKGSRRPAPPVKQIEFSRF